MNLEFKKLLFNNDCLDKPDRTISESTKKTYPGTQALESKGWYPKTVYISYDSTNTSGFSQKTGLEKGEPLFAVVETEPQKFSLYVFAYEENNGVEKYKPYDKGIEKVLNNVTRRWSLDKDDIPCCIGDQNKVNEEIIKILRKYKEKTK